MNSGKTRAFSSQVKQVAQSIGASSEGLREIVNELHIDFPEGG